MLPVQERVEHCRGSSVESETLRITDDREIGGAA